METKEYTSQEFADFALEGRPMPRHLSGKEWSDAADIIRDKAKDTTTKRAAFLVLEIGSAYQAWKALMSVRNAFLLMGNDEIKKVGDLLMKWHNTRFERL